MSEFPEFCAEIPSGNLVDSDLVRTIFIKTQIKSTDSARHVALHFRVRSPSPQMISMPYAGLVCPNCRRSAKQELKDRIMAAMDHFNQDPVVHTWSYKLDQAA